MRIKFYVGIASNIKRYKMSPTTDLRRLQDVKVEVMV
jgi:hypothetical protein